MKKYLFLLFLTLSMISYSQKSESKICNCSELTMKGKKGKSAFKDKNVFTGKCETKNSNGIISQELNYYNGQLYGETKKFYEKGNIKEITEYSGNMKHGKFILYNENGKPIIEGNYKNKQKDGKWKYYDKITGNLNKTVEYEFGKEKNYR